MTKILDMVPDLVNKFTKNDKKATAGEDDIVIDDIVEDDEDKTSES